MPGQQGRQGKKNNQKMNEWINTSCSHGFVLPSAPVAVECGCWCSPGGIRSCNAAIPVARPKFQCSGHGSRSRCPSGTDRFAAGGDDLHPHRVVGVPWNCCVGHQTPLSMTEAAQTEQNSPMVPRSIAAVVADRQALAARPLALADADHSLVVEQTGVGFMCS